MINKPTTTVPIIIPLLIPSPPLLVPAPYNQYTIHFDVKLKYLFSCVSSDASHYRGNRETVSVVDAFNNR